MCRPHFRIPRIDAQHAHASAFANNDIDGQETSASANAAEEQEIRMSRIRRNIATGAYLTREAAEKSASRLLESNDL